MRKVLFVLSALSLVACLAAPLAHFCGCLGFAEYKQVLGIATVAWFVFATLWVRRRPPLQ